MQNLNYKSGKSRGQALVEFALVLPLLLILTMLIIQYGIIFYTTIGITNLSREGARYAATAPASDDDIEERIEDVMPPSIDYDDLSIDIEPDEGSDDRVIGTRALISVEISYDMENKLFLPSTFLGVRVFSDTYTAQTTMMVE